MSTFIKYITVIATSLLVSFSVHAQMPELPPGAVKFENEDLLMIVMTRTPEQLNAFYTGRGFNRTSIDALTERCFVFGMVENKTQERLWLILDDWQFIDAEGNVIRRYTRDDWKQTWKDTGLEQAKQSTFGWTQLPEVRDLHRHEHVGGQVALPWQDQPFRLVATFRSGIDKDGKPHKVSFEDLECRKQ